MLLVALSALAIRLYGIGDHSLWVDEAASAAFSGASWHDLLVVTPMTETNPPGYYVLLKLWKGLFGTSEASLRMPSALFGAAATVPLYLIARSAAGRGAGLAAAALFAVSAIQVEYAQEARAFAGMTFAFLLAVWSGGRIAEAYPAGAQAAAAGGECASAWLFVPFVAGGAALPFLHHTGFLALGAVYVSVLALALPEGRLRWPLFRALVLSGIATMLLTAPVLFWIAVHLAAEETLVDWIPQPSLRDAYVIYRTVFGFAYLPHVGHLSEGASMLAWLASPRTLADLLLGVLCLWGLWASVRARRWHAVAAIAAITFVTTSYFLVSQVRPILLPRVIVYAGPLVLVIAAVGLAALPYRRLGLAAGALLIGLGAVATHRYAHQPEVEPWRTALTEAAVLQEPGLPVLSLIGELAGPVLVRTYWPGFSEAADVLLLGRESPPKFPFMTRQAPPHRHVGLDSLCAEVAGAEGVIVLERHTPAGSEYIEAARSALREAGASPVDERQYGAHIVVSSWSAPLAC